MKRKIIAVDFDGTLFTDDYPETGEPIWATINYCKEQQEKGAILILWTCRNGADLTEAVELCESVGLTFNYINENAEESLFGYARDSRKIYADEYVDDKARNPKEFL